MKGLEDCIIFWRKGESYCSRMIEKEQVLTKGATDFLGELKQIIEQTTSSLEELQQLKEKLCNLLFYTTTIGPSRSVPRRTRIRFLFEDEYQDFKKECLGVGEK